jgi:spore germination cell wall hydrolase CwlJ-like protein
LTIKTQAHAHAGALAGGLVLGAAVGLALGGAYLAGDMTQSNLADARLVRLAGAAAKGFSGSALQMEAQSLTPGALAVARRHDPATISGAIEHDRQAADLANRLEQKPASPPPSAGLAIHTSFTHPAGPAAQPFRPASTGPLDSSRDLDCLADAVYYEARGETSAGQAAVAQVVLNRVRHPAFPKSVCGVVFQGAHTGDSCQFSFACDGSMHRPREAAAWRRAEEVAAHALAGFVMPAIGESTHFHVAGAQPGWGRGLLRVAQVGLHVFYRLGGYIGSPSNFNAPPQVSSPGSNAPAQAVLASIIPSIGPSADGKPTGQLVLASATSVSAPSGPASPAPAPQAKSEAPTAAAPKTEPAPKGQPEAGPKTEASAPTAKPAQASSVS